MTEAQSNWTATLSLVSDSDSQTRRSQSENYVLSKKNTTFLGRSTECQIVLRSKYITVSRYHAKVEWVNLDGEFVWQVCDLETPNGTFVNDRRVDNCQPLKSGDRLTLGKPKGATFIFEYKSLGAEELVELFNKEQPYSKTYVPDLSDAGYPEFEVERLAKLQAEETNVASERSSVEPLNVETSSVKPLNVADADLPQEKKKQNAIATLLSKIPAKNLMGLILFFVIAPALIYAITTAFETKKAKNEVIKSYIGSISTLLLEKDLDNLNPFNQEARKARESANAQTRATLKSLDGPAKGSLIRFLYDSKLARLQASKLSTAWLSNPDKVFNKGPLPLSESDLQRQELIYSRQFNLESGATPLPVLMMNPSDFDRRQSEAQKKVCATGEGDKKCAWAVTFNSQVNEQPFLTPIQLSGADVTGVVLKNAPLDGINLEGAYLSLQSCSQESSGNLLDNFSRKWDSWFSKNRCGADFRNAGLQSARLFRAVFRGADLSNAKLDYADLREADLRDANLLGVHWSGAVLKGACFSKENWQQKFPANGPDGKPFDPIALGMKAVPKQQSDPNNPRDFQVCKDIRAS
ncbi:MAG: FHA domain-containing protein [Acaryochloridaceae cyanobacterium RU_4_10]|nr:FHA domain-containing protein [Acaryochloridaceae cyanobacterium RU_4_10]